MMLVHSRITFNFNNWINAHETINVRGVSFEDLLKSFKLPKSKIVEESNRTYVIFVLNILRGGCGLSILFLLVIDRVKRVY